MLPDCDSPDYNKRHDISKWNFFFFKKGLHILYMNVNSLLPKIDEIRFITKQSNVSILELLNPNSFILNSEVNIVGYDTIRMNHWRGGGGVVCYIKKSLSYDHKSSFCANIESILIDTFDRHVLSVIWQTQIDRVPW